MQSFRNRVKPSPSGSPPFAKGELEGESNLDPFSVGCVRADQKIPPNPPFAKGGIRVQQIHWGLGSLLCLLAFLALACSTPEVPVELGAKAPRFKLPDLDGKTVDSRDFAGRPLVINFWATWCQPCRREFPVLNEMAAEGEVRIVAIALDDEGAAAVAPFAEANGLEYPILIGNQEVFQRFKGIAIPYTLVLDAEQTLIGIYRGPATREDLDRDLEKLKE